MATVFFRGTYDEAFRLLVEARDYLTYREPSERAELSLDQRLAANREAMRLTSRLTQVMAGCSCAGPCRRGKLVSRKPSTPIGA